MSGLAGGKPLPWSVTERRGLGGSADPGGGRLRGLPGRADAQLHSGATLACPPPPQVPLSVGQGTPSDFLVHTFGCLSMLALCQEAAELKVGAAWAKPQVPSQPDAPADDRLGMVVALIVGVQAMRWPAGGAKGLAGWVPALAGLLLSADTRSGPAGAGSERQRQPGAAL